MLKIIKNPEFVADVTAMVPSAEGHTEATFKARFKVIPDDEYEEGEIVTKEGMKDFLRRAIVSLWDIEEEDGTQAVYGEELRERMLGVTYLRLALMRAYSTAMYAAKLGN